MIMLPRNVDYARRWGVLHRVLRGEWGWGNVHEDAVDAQSRGGPRDSEESNGVEETWDDDENWEDDVGPFDGSNFWPFSAYMQSDHSSMLIARDYREGVVVHVEATWVYEIGGVPTEPTFRVVAFRQDGVVTENDVIVDVMAGPTELLTEIGNGSTPKWREGNHPGADDDRGEELDGLLVSSPLKGAVVPQAFNGVVSTGATEVSEEAVLCSLEGRPRDQTFLQQLAREEVRDARRVKRTYTWFFCEPALDGGSLREHLRSLGMPSDQIDQLDEHYPVPVHDATRGAVEELIERTVSHLCTARLLDDIVELPLRTIALLNEPAGVQDLDEPAYEPGARWPHWPLLFPFMETGATDLA